MSSTGPLAPLLSARLATVGLLLALAAISVVTATTDALADGPTVTTDGETVTLANGLVERTFTLEPFGTVAMTDKRSGLSTGPTGDFALRSAVPELTVTGGDFAVSGWSDAETDTGGLAVTFELADATGLMEVTRTYTAFPGVAGFQVDTTVAAPGVWTGYTLDEVALPGATAAGHAFNAGYDWRGSDTPDWAPSLDPAGSAHTGDHREPITGATFDATGQWLSLLDSSGRSAFQVIQRVNYDSTHVAWDGSVGRVHVDLPDDLVYLGPFESDLHLDTGEGADTSAVEDLLGIDLPTVSPRVRTLLPGQSLRLETVFTGFGTDPDDEPWQHHRYLVDHRMPDWERAVTFNTNGTDDNAISTGAKDDVDFATLQQIAPIAARLGVDTFILDDGWQAASGDWCPDSPGCPEPRKATTGFSDRFPDDTFTAVRQLLADHGMSMGLWMSPMHFNPASEAFAASPEWSCTLLGDALAVYNTLEPDSSSNEAGLGTWNPQAVSLTTGQRLIEHIESRILRAIDEYGARYFKFDFLVWLDCADDVDPTDMYEYREEFVAMLDRVIAAHPDVTIQIDETNDYRLFPFESVARGPSWYANGQPRPNEALHNLWVLAPYVPGFTIGQGTLGRPVEDWSTDYQMAVALGSHLTFFSDVRDWDDDRIDTARRWTDLYHRFEDRFTGMTYPLLDDPLSGASWAALQNWDLDAQRGVLLAYRQGDPSASVEVPLRGIRQDRYELRDPFTLERVDLVTGEELSSGYEVSTADTDEAVVLLIDPYEPSRDGPLPATGGGLVVASALAVIGLLSRRRRS